MIPFRFQKFSQGGSGWVRLQGFLERIVRRRHRFGNYLRFFGKIVSKNCNKMQKFEYMGLKLFSEKYFRKVVAKSDFPEELLPKTAKSKK